jgi:hypothetical protein
MKHTIEKYTIEDVGLDELPADAPRVVVVARDAGATPVERYRRGAAAAGAVPAGKPLVALVRSGVLSTPDRFTLTQAARDGGEIQLTFEIRRYTGPISANVEREALAEIELGSLPPGSYVVVVTLNTRTFEDLQAPDAFTETTTTVERFPFQVQ